MTRPVQRPSSISESVLDIAARVQRQHEVNCPAHRRKVYGQFFTPLTIARFMARLFSNPQHQFRILDAGAGTGTLTAAICDRILRLRTPRLVEAVLVESDPTVLPLLEENMRYCRRLLKESGHDLTFTIENRDFVLMNQEYSGQSLLFSGDGELGHFDAVIMNPPYFKLNKASAHALAFEDVFRSQPNIYALFMAAGCMLLRPGGELVAITPRSFCNGLYFREFRRWFFAKMSLRHIHLFESRRDAFRSDSVLQESLITYWTKGHLENGTVSLTTSHGAGFSNVCKRKAYSYNRIIDDSRRNCLIRIPVTDVDDAIMDIVDSWPGRFADYGLRISTGPVVVFRSLTYLSQNCDDDAVPLLFPHNVRVFDTVWPVHKNGKPIALRWCAGSEGLLVPSRNYVLLKRFSAKEEDRRLTASCFVPKNGDWPEMIGIENHVNYIYHARRELTQSEVCGIAALFNSTFLDRYFRALSGNTQVNATEIRIMPFPSLDVVSSLGSAVKQLKHRTLNAVESLVLQSLAIDGKVVKELAGAFH